LDKRQVSRWRDVARVPKEKFEAHLKDLRRAGERITTAALVSEVQRAGKLDAIAEQARSTPALGAVKPCPVVYADPPWQYGNTAGASAAADQYPTMPLADICALKVPATKDAVLFLWATSPLLPEALQVVTAWGFTYKGSMVWDKGSGTGNWVLNAHELLLIAVRGDMPCPAPANRPVSVIRAPTSRHSEKPEAFAEAIERMFPGLPKVEMFARRVREGWATWGNEAA
jgi:N6-adenosine-specific RNA methylase IME4